MPRSAHRISTLLLIACLAPLSASAQIILEPKLRAAPTAPPAAGPTFSRLAVAPWPRLDPGAILCRTRADLADHSRAVAQRAAGQQVSVLGSPDCRVVAGMTAIDIVQRASPGATEVRVKGDPNTSWTDTWLPNQPPPR
ncbi:MAG TPA: hypothetical protein VHS58_04325 [Acetobacteraceae bacterium]|jgi:hypothetical protein|nr:hypothetical protein [Acetobacteraceae bacterium]